MKKFTIVLLALVMVMSLTISVFAYEFPDLTENNTACSIGFWAKNSDPKNADQEDFNTVFANDNVFFTPPGDGSLEAVLDYKEKGNERDFGNGNYLSLAKQLSAAYINQVNFAGGEFDQGLFDLYGVDLAEIWAEGNVADRDVSKALADELILYNAYQFVPGEEPSETACPAKSGWIK